MLRADRFSAVVFGSVVSSPFVALSGNSEPCSCCDGVLGTPNKQTMLNTITCDPRP